MVKRFYPAVLERAEGDMFAVWFPDFPGCVAAGRDQEEAAARAEEALAGALHEAAERGEALPVPTPFDAVETPADADVVAFLALGASPPDPSERVNIYLPKSLIERADEVAGRWGMSRSSLFGLAITRMLAGPYASPGASVIWTHEESAKAELALAEVGGILGKKKGRRP